MEYLVLRLICDGVKTIYKKIEVIANMMPPTSQKEVG